MKFSKKPLIILFAVIATCISLSFFKASAESTPITDQQIELIKNNCVYTKNTLNQLHSSDALLRVNMGQTYESISTKLMEKFNNRVSNASLSNAKLSSATNDYDAALDNFRNDYIIYERQLTLAINIDCSKQPVSFYDAINIARTERDQVHNDVLKLNQLIDQYQSVVTQFAKDYQAFSQGDK